MNKYESAKLNNQDIGPDAELAYQQALIYSRDMVALYKQEKLKREALQVAYQKLEIALESMGDGFLVIDKDLDIFEVNKACADLFELTRGEAQGKALSTLLMGTEVETFCHRLQHGKRTRHTTQLKVVLPTPRTLSIQAAPLPDGGWILILHDVTWEQRVNNMREEFLHLAAHELRTPLAGVIGFTSLLEQLADQHNLDEEGVSILDSILKSAERLRQTVNDILDFTVGDSGKTNIQELDLHHIASEALAVLSKKAAEKDISCTIDFPDDPILVLGNENMLTSAMEHLIENAILYNQPDGSLTIKASSEENTHKVEFIDTGKGISRKDISYILKPFYQVEEHTTRRSVGLGLGLSIVQRTIILHKGSLNVSSKLGEGSTFTITLPRVTDKDVDTLRQEWSQIQNRLEQHSKDQIEAESESQLIIQQLKQQLNVTQSQNLAYAQDLAKLYQVQREEAQVMEETKARVNHADRLALMGQLAAGVAHDLSNLIAPILGYSQTILRRRDSIAPNMADIIERILSTTRRANVLLRQMVTLSKTDSEKFELFDLNKQIEEMLSLLEVKIQHAHIDLIESYAENLPLVYGSTVQISQVILNLVINAIDAMPMGGVLTVKTFITASPQSKWIQLQISDTGQGIAPENLDHIFEAFFTTKEDKSGTGLGLSVTKQIVNNHQGKIFVDSMLGKGTTFTIHLPVNNRT